MILVDRTSVLIPTWYVPDHQTSEEANRPLSTKAVTLPHRALLQASKPFPGLSTRHSSPVHDGWRFQVAMVRHRRGSSASERHPHPAHAVSAQTRIAGALPVGQGRKGVSQSVRYDRASNMDHSALCDSLPGPVGAFLRLWRVPARLRNRSISG